MGNIFVGNDMRLYWKPIEPFDVTDIFLSPVCL